MVLISCDCCGMDDSVGIVGDTTAWLFKNVSWLLVSFVVVAVVIGMVLSKDTNDCNTCSVDCSIRKVEARKMTNTIARKTHCRWIVELSCCRWR